MSKSDPCSDPLSDACKEAIDRQVTSYTSLRTLSAGFIGAFAVAATLTIRDAIVAIPLLWARILAIGVCIVCSVLAVLGVMILDKRIKTATARANVSKV